MIVDISTNVCSSPKLSTVQKVHGGGSPHFGTYINFQSKAYTHTRVGTVHVFVLNRDGTGNSVQCMRPYDEFRQFTPNPEGGTRSNAKLFDNRQQNNSECRELRT